MKPPLIVYWIRRDFRLLDNPALSRALHSAAATHTPLLPLYILDNGILGQANRPLNIGRPRRQYLAQTLAQFTSQFPHFEIALGAPVDIFSLLMEEFELSIFVNDDVEPYSILRDTQIATLVGGYHFHSFTDQLTAPADIRAASSGNTYSVFTPYKNAVWADFLQAKIYPKVDTTLIPPLSTATKMRLQNALDSAHSLSLLKYTPPDLAAHIYEKVKAPWCFEVGTHGIDLDELVGDKNNIGDWYSTENEAIAYFQAYLDAGHMDSYKEARDDLGNDTAQKNHKGQLLHGKTSRMSVALKWGLVSSRLLKELIVQKYTINVQNPPPTSGTEGYTHYLSELIWREFYRYIILHHPLVLSQEFQPKFQGTIDWVRDDMAIERFVAWIKGETGYPAVDAAMHQIMHIGWMHNRSRMMVASILTKNLGVDWRWGQEYFRAMLLDLDEASNNGGWQWAASVGADPKPIRIFNPYLQAKNYDAMGEYQKKWLPAEYDALQPPLVEHSQARDDAMRRYHLGAHAPKRDF